MAWEHYYINCEKLYNPDEEEQELCLFYERKVPPHGSIRREWVTTGMKHGAAKIFLTEYWLEDDDIDGVWEAYGMKQESEYSFTVNGEQADPEKIFVYTMCNDGRLVSGYEVDTKDALAILVFAQPQQFTEAQLQSIYEEVYHAPRYAGEVERIMVENLLGGRENVLCLAYFMR